MQGLAHFFKKVVFLLSIEMGHPTVEFDNQNHL